MPDRRSQDQTAVLLVNTGSPSAPTRQALAAYLAEFLGDPRVVELPGWLWLPLLHGLIIPRRAAASAQRYRTVWTEQGSPLVATTARTSLALAEELGDGVQVAWAMRYGTHKVAEVLPELLRSSPARLVIVPMFAQYATQTTAAVYDAVQSVLKGTPQSVRVTAVHDYHDHSAYIEALADSVRAHWRTVGPLPAAGRLLISFHGIPQASSARGDPYESQCRRTAELLAQALGLDADRCAVGFQSRFGRARWLSPATDTVAQELAQQGVTRLDVICPGFAIDCLETLEEIAVELKKSYQSRGGRDLYYIPALNDSERAVQMYAQIVKKALATPTGS